MSAHRAIIEAGPGTVRRLCCGTGIPEVSESIGAALGAIDDRVALVGERPVAVESLWRAALRSVSCARGEGVVVVHPSWWSSSRVGVVTAAGRTMGGDVLVRPRSWLLARAFPAGSGPTVVVEIAEQLVAITAAGLTAVPRGSEARRVAEEVAAVVAGTAGVVLIDAAGGIAGARALADAIADAVRGGGRTIVRVDEAALQRLARSDRPAHAVPSGPRPNGGCLRSGPRLRRAVAAAAVVLGAAAPAAVAAVAGGRHAAVPVRTAPATFLVEGRVALTVPANWLTQRVLTGPGSARVRATSPSDREVALHITQSPVPGETLSGTAERLKRAIDAEPPGVFVDFNPSATSAGRPAVTYREVRATHHVRWTVLLDGAVRISIGCQSRPGRDPGDPGGYGAVREACEQAVRSAHAIG